MAISSFFLKVLPLNLLETPIKIKILTCQCWKTFKQSVTYSSNREKYKEEANSTRSYHCFFRLTTLPQTCLFIYSFITSLSKYFSNAYCVPCDSVYLKMLLFQSCLVLTGTMKKKKGYQCQRVTMLFQMGSSGKIFSDVVTFMERCGSESRKMGTSGQRGQQVLKL